MPKLSEEFNESLREKIRLFGLTPGTALAWDGSEQVWPEPPGDGDPHCGGCLQRPEQCDYGEYCEEGQHPNDYVRSDEGTYDRESGWFLCDVCYIKMGQPTAEQGSRWTATPAKLKALIGWT